MYNIFFQSVVAHFLRMVSASRSLKHRADTEKGLPSDLETFEQLCDVLKTAFETNWTLLHEGVTGPSSLLSSA